MTTLARPLTPRELEAMYLLSEGWTRPAVAEQMGIAIRTVETMMGRVFDKTGTCNLPHATKVLSLAGLLDSHT